MTYLEGGDMIKIYILGKWLFTEGTLPSPRDIWIFFIVMTWGGGGFASR